MVQVRAKMVETRRVDDRARDAFFFERAIAVVRAPNDRFHVVDHHHWARARIELGVAEAPVKLVADLGALDEPAQVSTGGRTAPQIPYARPARREICEGCCFEAPTLG
jgi:hypothetical protein